MTAPAAAATPLNSGCQDMPCHPQSAGAARRAVRARLTAWRLDHLTESAELLVSELVGNAVRHSGCRSLRLHITRNGAIVRVGVQDSSRTLPVRIVTNRVQRGGETGRGLHLVHQLSNRWGADLEPHGKTVWFELVAHVTRAATADSAGPK